MIHDQYEDDCRCWDFTSRERRASLDAEAMWALTTVLPKENRNDRERLCGLKRRQTAKLLGKEFRERFLRVVAKEETKRAGRALRGVDGRVSEGSKLLG